MEKIFVAIASYRDTECQWTVKDLFEAASCPERISVGICWQFDAAKDGECFIEPHPRPDQVRVINVTLQETRGACWAKSKAISLAKDEQYILLIDSHMRFAKDWDLEMIAMLGATSNPRAFLSAYPAGYEPPNQRRFNTPRLAPVKFFDRVMSQNSVVLDLPRPMESYLVAGGYVFAHRQMFDEVPYDPHIYFIGEEITLAARYFTHGWVGYTPNKCLIHHYYARKTSVRHWEDEKDRWSKINTASYNRVRHILGIERTGDPAALIEIEKYGLGRMKSLAQFQAAIGVNFNAQFIDRKRHETLVAIEAAIAKPLPPKSSHELASLGVYACRHGQFLIPKLDDYIGKSLIQYGEWAEGLNTVFAALFPAGGVVIEIGAGFGAHTVPLARLAGSDGRVFAVEQSRRMVDLVHANLALNAVDNVQVIHARVGVQRGSVHIGEPIFNSASNFGVVSVLKTPDASKASVQVIQLDTHLLGRLDFMFIDVPGGASDVLQSVGRVITARKPAMVLNADNEVDAAQALKILSNLGYQAWWYSCPFFDTNNFFANADNVFGSLRSRCILAVPDERDLSALNATRASNADQALVNSVNMPI
jgi:FkbM family methyltransferase